MSGQMSFNNLMALVPMDNARAVAPGQSSQKGRKTLWSRLRFHGGEFRDPEKERAVAQQMFQRQYRASNLQRRGRDVKDDTRPPRFGTPDDKKFSPTNIVDVPSWLQPHEWEIFLKEQRLEDLSNKLMKNDLEFGDPDLRPSSPPPTYDRIGNRTNTRDVRIKSAMTVEYNLLTDFLVKKCGHEIRGWFSPSPDWKSQKKIVRIIIPQDKYKEQNFMGLIIGPRGCNHKRLEAESGTQISIRGQGTLKEGKKTDHQTEEEANMPQHVHISADDDEKVQKAVELIEPLLDPQHPMHEDFKNRGLDQLALVHGTTVQKPHSHSLAIAGSMCEICGGAGHYSWKCPEAHEFDYDRADVQCALCGDKGHPTMDCKIVRDKKLTSRQVAELEKRAEEKRTRKQTRLERLKAEAQGLQEAHHQGIAAQAQMAALPSTGGMSSMQAPGDYDRLMGDLFGEQGNQAYKKPCLVPTSRPSIQYVNPGSMAPTMPGGYQGLGSMPMGGMAMGGQAGYGGYSGAAVYGQQWQQQPGAYGAQQTQWNPYYQQQWQQQQQQQQPPQ
eukprot:GHVH01016027.1.p1 GENE.GHVH01016027.1~~GHVH01016027.1.p1  ORF type:complete len:553 (+),score=91.89 GHVH01016027.1:52-1710(+)